MAIEHGVRKNRLSPGGDEVAKNGILTPLYEEGEKGGNSESPLPVDTPDFSPPDPLGLLPKGAEERGRGRR